ncbi:MAG: hypothetical protein ABWW65_03865 [Thermoprotei archaeon]
MVDLWRLGWAVALLGFMFLVMNNILVSLILWILVFSLLLGSALTPTTEKSCKECTESSKKD